MKKETLKKLQQQVIDKYNRSSSKETKRRLYAEICRYEDLLFKLKETQK